VEESGLHGVVANKYLLDDAFRPALQARISGYELVDLFIGTAGSIARSGDLKRMNRGGIVEH
jgi:hypothetical protein